MLGESVILCAESFVLPSDAVAAMVASAVSQGARAMWMSSYEG
jgi:hypothetical protein